MKKTLVITALLCLSSAIYAQKARIGLTFSPTFGFLRTLDPNLEKSGARAGFSYGLLFDYRIDNNERYAFSSGFFHSLTGGNYIAHFPDTSGTDTLTVTHNLKPQYLNIPLTLRLRTNEIGYITYYGQFGLNLGVMVSPLENRTSVPAKPTDGNNVKLEHNVIPSIALHIGGGIEYSLSGATALLVGIFYDNGFTGVVNDPDFGKISLRNIGLRAGIIF
jgi:hypothetical protein